MKQPIEFVVNGLTLRGNIYTPEEAPKNLALLFLHGWMGMPNEQAAEALAKNGYYAMTFSLSGHNDSDGKIEDQTRDKSLSEVIAAYEYFRNTLPKDVKIGAVGTSYGSYLAVLLSKVRPLVCLQLRVPANFWDEHFDEPQIDQSGDNSEVRQWRQRPLNFNATRALMAVHNFEGPIQILEAEQDDVVPHQTVQNYVDAVRDKSKLDYRVMNGWGHGIGLEPARNLEFQQVLLNWLNEQAF
jgi:esterase/lipase